MTDRITDNPELLVDEVKRKARRRLVGAIVLALAAAVILPLLLEKEPRPLGDDVSVQIPPVDEGKFVNRLTGKSGEAKALPRIDEKSAPKADDKGDAKGTAIKAEARTEAPVAAPAPAASIPAATPAPSTASAEASAPKKSAPEAAQRAPAPAAKAESKPVPAPSARVEPGSAAAEAKPTATEVAQAPPAASSAAPPATPSAAKSDGFVVQLAAFADDKGANSLANRLKKVGYAAYVEPVNTSRGTLWRVRVGGYASRSEADAARAKLKGEGYSGIVAPSK